MLKVRLYVAVVTAGAIAVAIAAGITVPANSAPNLAALLVLGLSIGLAELLQVRYLHADGIEALTLCEGVAAPLVFHASGTQTAVVVAAALLLAGIIGRNAPVKTVFNAAQWVLSLTCASLVINGLRGHVTSSSAAVLLVCAGIFVAATVNAIAVVGVLTVRGGRIAMPQPRTFINGHALSLMTNLTAAVVLTAAYHWTPWTLAVGVIVVVQAHAAGKAIAAVRVDRSRLEGMQRATHALATALDSATGLPRFLAEVRLGFEVSRADLVLFGGERPVVHSCTGTVQDGYRQWAGQHVLAEALLDLKEPTYVGADGDAELAALLRADGHSRVLAAPLRAGGSTIGLLFLYDRIGVEGFEAGELKVVDALARELVGFLERVQLLQAIDEERRKLAEILGATSDGIFSLEADGLITSWNAGLEAMSGYSADELVGTRHCSLLRPRDGAGRDVLMERWLETLDGPNGLPAELQIITASGETVWLSCSYSRIPASDVRRDALVVVARNITQARELERLKDDFVAVVSHELRTPLVPIRGWAQTLLNRGDRLSDDQRRTAVQSILAQSQKLESLILNILESSRIEAGRGEADGVADVVGITAHLVDDTLAARPERVVRLRPPEVPCAVKGSAVWVERAVANLLANAIKYSPDEAPVDVTITPNGDSVVVAVTDRGPGIAGDAQERIFERFERLEETRTQTGTGLGLYITRRLARAMGGDVTVSSLPGAGSTFLLRLPLAALPAAVPRIPQQQGDEPRRVVNLR